MRLTFFGEVCARHQSVNGQELVDNLSEAVKEGLPEEDRLGFLYRKPFDVIAIRNEEAKMEKAASDSTCGLSPR